MKKIKAIIFLVSLITSFQSYCQTDDKVEMADILRQDGKIYTVVFGLVIILTGMIILLLRVDRKIFRIESQMNKKE